MVPTSFKELVERSALAGITETVACGDTVTYNISMLDHDAHEYSLKLFNNIKEHAMIVSQADNGSVFQTGFSYGGYIYMVAVSHKTLTITQK